jgi:hypothetical protein
MPRPKASVPRVRHNGTAPAKGYACQELLRENGFPYRKFMFLNFNDMRKEKQIIE